MTVLCCRYIGKQFTLVYYTYILRPCYNQLLVPVIFFFLSTVWDFLHRQSFHLGMRFLFLSLQSIYLPPFCYVIGMASMMSSMMLNRSGERGHSCLFSIREKASSLSPLSKMLPVGFWKIFIIKLSKFLSILRLLRVFIINRYWILSNIFSLSIALIIYFFL